MDLGVQAPLRGQLHPDVEVLRQGAQSHRRAWVPGRREGQEEGPARRESEGAGLAGAPSEAGRQADRRREVLRAASGRGVRCEHHALNSRGLCVCVWGGRAMGAGALGGESWKLKGPQALA